MSWSTGAKAESVKRESETKAGLDCSLPAPTTPTTTFPSPLTPPLLPAEVLKLVEYNQGSYLGISRDRLSEVFSRHVKHEAAGVLIGV